LRAHFGRDFPNLFSSEECKLSVLILLFGFTLALSTLFVFGVLRFAKKRSLFDQIDERKVHTEQIPRLGGVGFISAYMVVIFALTVLGFWGEQLSLSFSMVLAAMTLILIFGIWDDLKPLRARYKMGIQILAALLMELSPHRSLDRWDHQRHQFNRWYRWSFWGAFVYHPRFLWFYFFISGSAAGVYSLSTLDGRHHGFSRV